MSKYGGKNMPTAEISGFMLKYNVHSTAQHSTAQHSTAQHSTAQHSTARALLARVVLLLLLFFAPLGAQAQVWTALGKLPVTTLGAACTAAQIGKSAMTSTGSLLACNGSTYIALSTSGGGGGGLALLPDGTACTAGSAGQVKFNATSRVMQYCDPAAAVWKNVATTSPASQVQFTTTGTQISWTVPATVNSIDIIAVGGGGSGGPGGGFGGCPAGWSYNFTAGVGNPGTTGGTSAVVRAVNSTTLITSAGGLAGQPGGTGLVAQPGSGSSAGNGGLGYATGTAGSNGTYTGTNSSTTGGSGGNGGLGQTGYLFAGMYFGSGGNGGNGSHGIGCSLWSAAYGGGGGGGGGGSGYASTPAFSYSVAVTPGETLYVYVGNYGVVGLNSNGSINSYFTNWPCDGTNNPALPGTATCPMNGSVGKSGIVIFNY